MVRCWQTVSGFNIKAPTLRLYYVSNIPNNDRLSRFLGSCCTVGFAFLRWKYWPDAFAWLASPLVLWSLAAFLLVDLAYGVCLYLVSRAEALSGKVAKVE